MDTIKGRVASINRSNYKVFTSNGIYQASISGRFHYNAISEEDYPIVGDHVLMRQTNDNEAIIERIIERKNKMSRMATGNVVKAQYIAANVDIVFICMSLNEDFNIRKLQNLINLTYSVDATPVILLTKRDLVDDMVPYVTKIRSITDMKIVPISVFNNEMVQSFLQVIKSKTSVLVGSSGVGKSTIINTLLNEELLQTTEIRLSDAQGRHTTTYRELIMIDSDTYIIDTPGIRIINSYQVDGIDDKFSDIALLAEDCSFRDCSHNHEPNCNVIHAIEHGELNPERLYAFNKVKRTNRVARAKEIAKFRKQIKQKRR